jgi:hypothetical protein
MGILHSYNVLRATTALVVKVLVRPSSDYQERHVHRIIIE